MRKVNLDAIVLTVGATRTVNLKAGGQSEVADIVVGDETGEITLTLWNEEIDKVVVGSRVNIRNGYTNSYQGKIRLNVGRFGSLEVIE